MTSQERKGDWLETYTGKKFWVLDPRPEDVCIEDIAHGLSNVCRYNGQCSVFFSVAQHSLNCVLWAEKNYLSPYQKMLCLLHDAAEAYIGDVVRPLKKFLPEFMEAEERTLGVIYEALLGNQPDKMELQVVKLVDNIMLVTEARVLMPLKNAWGDWSLRYEPDKDIVIELLPPDEVERRFLQKYAELAFYLR